MMKISVPFIITAVYPNNGPHTMETNVARLTDCSFRFNRFIDTEDCEQVVNNYEAYEVRHTR